MKTFTLILFVVIVATAIYLVLKPSKPAVAPTTNEPASSHLITLKTSQGIIKFKTYDEDAPTTVTNFISLASKGFYTNLSFHRVVKGFVVQGGDPLCANPPRGQGFCGTGGPGYQFDDELNPNSISYNEGYKKGVVAMANSGPNTNGSQFFIMLEDDPTPPHAYTIFGKVIEGQDVVDSIGSVEVDANDRPLQSVLIEEVTVGS